MLRPAFMFTPDGNWKEFGIGQREDRYTPFPFWLFCLTWALVSYVLVLLLKPLFESAGEEIPIEEPVNTRSRVNTNRRANKKNVAPPPLPPEDVELEGDGEDAVELPKGYYVLNKKATKLSGVPKYVYLGPEEPTE